MPGRERSRRRNAEIEAAHEFDDPFAAAVRSGRIPVTITDPREPDNPLVYVNDAFARVTGYPRDEVIGRNCRFLQGPGTDQATVARIRAAVERGEPIEVELLNYRRDGTPFWNVLFISPVRDAAGDLVFFYGTQVDLTARKALERDLQSANEELAAALARQDLLLREVDHRVKNNLQLVASLLHLQSRSFQDAGLRTLVDGMIERVAAIGTLHTKLYQATDVHHVDVGAYLADLARDTLATSGRGDTVRLDLDIDPVAAARVPARDAASLGLIVNELVTNALKHAFPNGRPGRLTLRLAAIGPSGAPTLEVEDDGIGRDAGQLVSPRPRAASGFGTTLLTMLAKQLRTEVAWEDATPGTRVRLLPRANGSTSLPS
ncbi:PAS sensor protein (plasmid) [Methylorubrum populi]|jgi:PAS domain S-box-containing protein|uniref:PAS sensor protein n=1 Tax=Methylorubrum populi TaxID=223967 RepID=A0A160PMN2_9HYPH|nr:PAS domain-containing protein [Methylorubrum populi]BAU94043.1 PAS sensor protein [Methylorubrum populi]